MNRLRAATSLALAAMMSALASGSAQQVPAPVPQGSEWADTT